MQIQRVLVVVVESLRCSTRFTHIIALHAHPIRHACSSAFQGVMASSLGGYQGLMWGREANEFKTLSCSQKAVERIWSPSPSLGDAAATWQGVFVDGLYMTPSGMGRCDYNANSTTCNYALAAKDVDTLITSIINNRAPNVRLGTSTTDLLLNFGYDDFTSLTSSISSMIPLTTHDMPRL